MCVGTGFELGGIQVTGLTEGVVIFERIMQLHYDGWSVLLELELLRPGCILRIGMKPDTPRERYKIMEWSHKSKD